MRGVLYFAELTFSKINYIFFEYVQQWLYTCFSNEKFIPLKNSPGPLSKRVQVWPGSSDNPRWAPEWWPSISNSTILSEKRPPRLNPPGNPKRWVHVPGNGKIIPNAYLEDRGSDRYMGVSKNRGTPTWMVYNGKPWKTLLKWMVLGVPLFSETSIYFQESHGKNMAVKKISGTTSAMLTITTSNRSSKKSGHIKGGLSLKRTIQRLWKCRVTYAGQSVKYYANLHFFAISFSERRV